jgi:hypothetical protein
MSWKDAAVKTGIYAYFRAMWSYPAANASILGPISRARPRREPAVPEIAVKTGPKAAENAVPLPLKK